MSKGLRRGSTDAVGSVRDVRKLWVHRFVDAPADVVWALLCDLRRWPEWGPTVRHAELSSAAFGPRARGRVTTVANLKLPFEITDYDENARWAWKVAGMPATDHTVDRLSDGSCRVGFGVPWPAAPYLAVCRTALGRIERLAIVEAVHA